MFVCTRRFLTVTLSLPLSLGPIWSQTAPEPPAHVVPEFWFPAPAPVLSETAAAAGIPLSGYERDPTRTELAPGDTVVFLVELVDGTKQQQWLVTLTGSALTAEEQAKEPPGGLRFFTTSGRELSYDGRFAALAIRVLGPVAATESASPPKDVQVRTLVNGQFLELGFARAEMTMKRFAEARAASSPEDSISPQFNFAARTKPYSEEELAKGREAAARMGVTEEDERAVIGSAPALIEFFNVANRTPGVNRIVRSVIHVPVWSILARGGRGPDLGVQHLGSGPLNPVEWNLEESAAIFLRGFTLQINQRPALTCRMTVVEADAPLVASSGVLALAAGRPDGKGPRLMLWAIAARLARPVEAADLPVKN